MDDRRRTWLDERQAAVTAAYDDEAATYDDDAYPVPLHVSFVQRLAETCPKGGVILDAPCGTGRYFSIVKETGRRVVGADQSAGMLARARARGIADDLEQVALQDLTYVAAFDGVMTVDALENVPPEDWPLVLANLDRAVRPGGHLYFTVEEIDPTEIDAAFAEAQRLGVPAIHGEVVEGDTAGYHYYPGRERVMSWLGTQDLTVVDEAVSEHDGWSYRHFLVRSAGS